MKSSICTIKKGGVGLETILSEVEKVAVFNELPFKESLRLRLLAEELTGMLPELVKNFEGIFWVQNEGKKYELHVELSVDSMSRERKDQLLAVSASQKNAAAKGFMGKIREVAENMLLSMNENGSEMSAYCMQECMCDYGINMQQPYTYAWTLEHYSTRYKEEKERHQEVWDQLEKSIVAKLADDVLVGVRGRNVDIIIKKEF